jgi:hypothetical protein
MYQGKLNKARRGEWFATPPIGDVWSPDRRWAIDPDEQVRAVVRLIFDQFDREATPHGLLRHLVHHQIRLPVRPAGGPNRGHLEWHRPSRARLLTLLKQPSYAGAYRYGHRPVDPRRTQPGRPGTGKRACRPDERLVILRDHRPAYITWARFEANQHRLTANRTTAAAPGAPRNGPSLLAGLVRCGRRGQGMVVRHDGRRARVSYSCPRAAADYGEPLRQGRSCGAALDAVVARQLLAAVADVERQRRTSSGSGTCGVSGRRTRWIGRAGSTRRASRRTGWWPANWNAAGRWR